MIQETNPPILTKVGAVVLRVRGDAREVLVIQPKPKIATPHDLPPIGLVRGTRAYRGADGRLVDANHDGRTPPPEGAVLEPVHETLIREIEEEAGVTPAMLANAQVIELGPRLFASAKKTPYLIHWFVVVLEEAAQAALPHQGLTDSLHSEWVSLATFAQYVEEKRASRGYIALIEEAMQRV